jgi:hypothetical protein
LSTRFHGQPLLFMMQRILQLEIVSRTVAPRDEEITPEGSDPMAGGDPEAEPKVRQRHAVFCFETVDVGLLEQPAMNEVLNQLFHPLSEGVRITELVLEHVFMTRLRFSVAGSFLREMLGVCSARGRGLKRFEYSCGDFKRDTIGAVCSALALSQTISEFAFTESGTGRGVDRSAW